MLLYCFCIDLLSTTARCDITAESLKYIILEDSVRVCKDDEEIEQTQRVNVMRCCHFVHNVTAVYNSEFVVFGKILATSVIYGDVSMHCFLPAVADFVVNKHVTSLPEVEW